MDREHSVARSTINQGDSVYDDLYVAADGGMRSCCCAVRGSNPVKAGILAGMVFAAVCPPAAVVFLVVGAVAWAGGCLG